MLLIVYTVFLIYPPPIPTKSFQDSGSNIIAGSSSSGANDAQHQPMNWNNISATGLTTSEGNIAKYTSQTFDINSTIGLSSSIEDVNPTINEPWSHQNSSCNNIKYIDKI